MNWTPLVSVIVPTFNRRHWIGLCLDSIHQQTYPNIQTLVVDDGSSDGTVEWIRSQPNYQFAEVHVQPSNRGASIARNLGVELALGELVVFIDSDDLLAPTHVEAAVRVFAERPKVGLFCCDSSLIDEQGAVMYGGRTWHEIQSGIRNYPVETGVRTLADILLFSNIFPGFTVRRDVFQEVSGFHQGVFPLDDYDFALRVAAHGRDVYYCHQPLAIRRDHPSQCSGAANGVTVSKKILHTIDLAVERNPELRALGFRLRRRRAELHVDLAVNQWRARQAGSAVVSLLGAFAHHPPQFLRVARLAGSRFARTLSR